MKNQFKKYKIFTKSDLFRPCEEAHWRIVLSLHIKSEIHGGYMGDTWEIHGRYMGDTWEMHGRYMGDTRRLGPRTGTRPSDWDAGPRRGVSPMYLPCISHVSPMYLQCISHVSPMYLPCIPHVSPMYLRLPDPVWGRRTGKRREES